LEKTVTDHVRNGKVSGKREISYKQLKKKEDEVDWSHHV